MSPLDRRDPKSRAAADALGKWLRGFDWTHWIHFSFRKSVSPDIARKAFNLWLSAVEKKGRAKTPQKTTGTTTSAWARAVEAGESGRFHIHALAHVPWRNRDLQSEWRWGDSKISRYDAAQDGAFYLAKVAMDSDGHFDMSDDLPPVRSDQDETETDKDSESPYTSTDNRWLFTDEELKEAASTRAKARAPMRTTRNLDGTRLKQFATRLDTSLFRDLRIATAEDGETITRVANRAIRHWLRRRAKRRATKGHSDAQQQ